jgi:hypothetical protein
VNDENAVYTDRARSLESDPLVLASERWAPVPLS